MHCAYCGAYINYPFTGKDKSGEMLDFCDILCGRLYDQTIQEIYPYMKRYNKLYTQNKLTVKSKKLFERLNDYGLFKAIPICVTQQTPLDTKQYYYVHLGV